MKTTHRPLLTFVLLTAGLACRAVAQDATPSPSPAPSPLPPVKMTVNVGEDMRAGQDAAASPTPAQDAGALISEATQAMATGNFATAKALLDQALALSPDDGAKAIIYNDMGGIHAYKRERDQAEAFFTKAVQADPQFAEAWCNLAGALDDKGDHAKAMEDFDKAIALKPGSSSTLFNRGRALENANEHEKAIADLNESIRIQPGNRWAWLIRASAHDNLGDHAKAIADFSEALRLEPRFVEAYTGRGTALSFNGDYAKAREDFAAALEVDPKYPVALNNMAWLLATCPDAAVRDGKKAVDFAQQACEASQWQHAGCIDTLAASYAESGDFDNAVKFEQWYLDTIGGSAQDAAPGKARLALYQAHKPYREEKKP